MKLLEVKRLYADGNHNAFTDMIRYKQEYYLTFRSCPDGHGIFPSSSIVIMRSNDGETWEKAHSFSVPGRDVRDPHFLNVDGVLFVYSGAWPAEKPGVKDYPGIRSYLAYSQDGRNWSPPQLIDNTEGYYFWRAASFGGTHYMCGKRYWPSRGFRVGHDPDGRESVLLKSDDGISWQECSVILGDFGDETAFTFDDTGLLKAIVRTVGSRGAYLCRSKPPYKEWNRKELPHNIGGPLLVRLPDGRYLAGGRLTTQEEGPKTVLFWLEEDQLHPCLTLPSGGDNSYPGFVALDESKGLVSYYSSHEGSTDIYLALVQY